MKPYQVKLRIIGILSIIVSMLVLWLPMPSRAAGENTPTRWQNAFSVSAMDYVSVSGINSYEGYLDLHQYTGDPAYIDSTEPRDTVVDEPGKITIRDTAVDGSQKKYQPRIGATPAGTGIFSGKTSLREADLTNAKITSATASLEDLFNGCTALEAVRFPGTVDASNITNTKGMFRNCLSLKELDLSMFDFSSLTAENAADMFTGCNQLDVIKTPVNVMNNNNNYAGKKIALPGLFRFTGKDGNVYEVDHLLTADDFAVSGKGSPSDSFTLTRVKDLTSMKVLDGTKDLVTGGSNINSVPSSDEILIDVDEEKEFTVVLAPDDADNPEAEVSFAGGTGAEMLSVDPVSPAKLTVRADGTATFKVKGLANGNVTVRVTGKSTSGNLPKHLYADIKVKVQKQDIKVTGVTLDKTAMTIDAAAATPATLTATIQPLTADIRTVTWETDPAGIVTLNISGNTVTPVPEKIGTAKIIARSVGDPKKTAECEVTVTSSYTLTEDDRRTDTSNLSYTAVTNVQVPPVRGNRKMVIETVDADSSNIKSQVEALGVTDSRDYSCFRLRVTDPSGNTVNTPDPESYGNVTLRMAVKGDMWYRSGNKRMAVYAYNGGGTKPTEIKTTGVRIDNYAEGVEFTVEAGTLAREYAVVLVDADRPQNLKLEVRESRSDQMKSKVAKTEKTTQNSDLYLHIREMGVNGVPESKVLKPYVEEHEVFKSYKVQKYYDVFLSSDADGNNRVENFTECEVRLAIPAEADPASPWFTVLTETQNGTAADTVGGSIVTEGSQYYKQYTPTHFSEVAVLDTSDDAVVTFNVATTHTGTGTTVISSGAGVMSVTPGTGQDAAVAVVAGNRVTVTAVEGPEYRFSHWQEGTNPEPVKNEDGTANAGAQYTFAVTGDRTLTAVFTENTTDPQNNGSEGTGGNGNTPGTGNNGNNGNAPAQTGKTINVRVASLPSTGGKVNGGGPVMITGDKSKDTATLTAEPFEGFTFVAWKDPYGNTHTTPELVVSLDGNFPTDAIYTAYFDDGSGTVTEDTIGRNGQSPETATATPNVNITSPIQNEAPVNLNAPVTVTVDTNDSGVPVIVPVDWPGWFGTGSHIGATGYTGVYPMAGPPPGLRAGNAKDMPTTGVVDIYRVMIALILVLSGTVELLLSIPSKKRRRVAGGSAA